MFGFGKKKEPSPQKANRARRSEDFEERKAQSRAQLGFLVGIDDDPGTGASGGGSLDIDDVDLENELLMLIGDSPERSRSKAPVAPKRNIGQPQQKPKPGGGVDSLSFDLNLDDEGQHDNDDEDLDDPDLQAELGEILGDHVSPVPASLSDEDDVPAAPTVAPTMSQEQLVKLLHDRLILYEKAKVNAEIAKDSGKTRRFTRGVKTLKELLSKAKAGRNVDEADIPPVVSLGIAAAPTHVVPSLNQNPSSSDIGSAEPSFTEADQQSSFLLDPNRDHLSPSPQPSLPEPLQPIPASVPSTHRPRPEPKIDYETTPSASLPRQPDPIVDYGPVQPVPRLQQLEPPVDYEPVVAKSPVSIPSEVEVRLKEYKKMAIILKRNQDTQGALHYLKLSKALEAVINSGSPVDISQFPQITSMSQSEGVHEQVGLVNVPPAPSQPETIQMESTADNPPPADEQSSEDIFGAPPAPTSVMEALEQRLNKYKSEVEKANSSSNASKARRMGRIVKQYEEAIVSYKKGKPVPYDELPTPPGFAQIPAQGFVPGASVPEPVQVNVKPQPRPGPSSAFDDSVSPEKKVKPSPPTQPGISPSATGSTINRGSGKPVTKLTLQEKQLALIMQRQKQYRDGALEAKKRGDVNQAREYLRISKGFDKLIEASQSGLPVDISTLPSPPEAIASLEAEDFEVVSEADCISATGSLSEIFAKLEEDLKQQLKMCMRTRDHFKSIGDVASANRFESMALETKRDLDTIRMAAKTGQELPKYHYETRIFSITECNTDIKEDEIEITVVQGVNFKGSSSLDTFVRIELPYPTVEEAQSHKSQVVKDSTDPAYNVTCKLNINRTARNFQRFTHRHGVKFEVWSKGGLCTGGLFFCGCRRGFLRASTLLGTATAKLQPLETKCNLHDAFDILDGRKVVGKLEVKIRIRDPVLTKQITQKKEKWLSIDRS